MVILLRSFVFLFIFNFVSDQCVGRSFTSSTNASDSTIRQGNLSNGFSYFVAKTGSETAKVVVKLVVAAGYEHEDSSQSGLAHVLEHVALKGTKNFPKGIYYYLDKLGIKRGSDVNAATGLTATVYYVSIPRDSLGKLNHVLEIFHELSNSLLLRSEDIEIERRSVLAELNGSKDITGLRFRTVNSALLRNTPYEQRISDEDVVDFAHSDLVRFYSTWYKPCRQGIIIAGSVDLNVVEAEIRRLFDANDERSVSDCKREIPGGYFPGKEELMVFSDSAQIGISLQIFRKFKAVKSFRSNADIRYRLLMELFNAMISNRLSMADKASQGKPGGISTVRERGLLGLPGTDLGFSMINFDSVEQIKERTTVFFQHLLRIRDRGFSDRELEIAKRSVLHSLPMPSDGFGSDEFAQLCMTRFLYGDTLMGSEENFQLKKELLSSISVKDVNYSARLWLNSDNCLYFFSAPELIKDQLPSLDEIKKYWVWAERHPLPSFDFPVSPDLKRLRIPKGHRNYEVKRYDSAGISEILLSNGVSVILVPGVSEGYTRDKKILINAVSRKNVAAMKNRDYFLTLASVRASAYYGLANLGQHEFQDFLNRNDIQVEPYSNDLSIGVKGSFNVSNAPLAFDVISQYLTNPRIDRGGFDRWKADEIKSLLGLDYRVSILDSINRYTRERELMLPVHFLQTVKYDELSQNYIKNFTALDDLQVIVCGKFEIDSLLPDLVKYFGSLRIRQEDSSIKDSSFSVVAGTALERKFVADNVGGHISLRFSGKIAYDGKNAYEIEALRSVLERCLTNRLREVEKGVYVVVVQKHVFRFPVSRYILSIDFNCASTRVGDMVNAVVDEVEKLKVGLVEEDLFRAFVLSAESDRKGASKNKRFWTKFLTDSYLNREPISQLFRNIEYYKSIKREDIRTFANRYLTEGNCLKFIVQ